MSKADKLTESQLILQNNRNIGGSSKKSMATNKVDFSHPECDFCTAQFSGMSEEEIAKIKKRLIKKGAFAADNKEEEYFRMCLLSYQIKYKGIQKILTLDHNALYRQAAQQ